MAHVSEPHPLPPAWLELAAQVNSRTTFGDAGVRDPAHPCEGFEPVKNPDWLGVDVRAPGGGDCDSDGHYLCSSCEHLSDQRIDDLVDA